MNKKPISTLSLAIALLLGSSGQALAQVPGIKSAEFRSMGPLGAINIHPAWEAGALGQGITVALLDTGVRGSHFELRGRIASGGRDFVDGAERAHRPEFS